MSLMLQSGCGHSNYYSNCRSLVDDVGLGCFEVRSFLGKIGHMLDSELEDFVEPLASNRPDTVEELKAVASTMFEVVPGRHFRKCLLVFLESHKRLQKACHHVSIVIKNELEEN